MSVATIEQIEVNGETYDIAPPGGYVKSFNGRQGAVTPQSGDYSTADITGLTEALAGKAGDAELSALETSLNAAIGKKANSTDLEPLRTGITEAKTAAASATSRTWTVSVGAAAWVSGTDTWSGITAGYKAEVTASGMTEATQIGSIAFAGGDLTSAGLWRYLRPGAGKVTLYSEEKPGKDFSLILTEVK